jgi:hypothetical protein
MVMSALGLAALDDPTWGPLTGALAAASMATAWVIVWLAVAAWSARQEPRSRPPALEVDARGIQVGGRFTAWHDISGWTEQDGGITFFDGTLRRVRTPRLRPAERAIFTTLAASRVGSPREFPAELETLRARVSA